MCKRALGESIDLGHFHCFYEGFARVLEGLIFGAQGRTSSRAFIQVYLNDLGSVMNLILNDWDLTRRIMHDKRCTRRMTESSPPARLGVVLQGASQTGGGAGGGWQE